MVSAGKGRQGKVSGLGIGRFASFRRAQPLSTLVYYLALGRSGQKGGDLEYQSLMRRWLRVWALDGLVCTKGCPSKGVLHCV